MYLCCPAPDVELFAHVVESGDFGENACAAVGTEWRITPSAFALRATADKSAQSALRVLNIKRTRSRFSKKGPGVQPGPFLSIAIFNDGLGAGAIVAILLDHRCALSRLTLLDHGRTIAAPITITIVAFANRYTGTHRA